MERARTRLLVRIADGLSDGSRERTTVVFDAADPPPDATPRMRFREMSVLFSVETGEADALIEELIRRHPAPRQLRVVSDDRRLQKAAKRRGAQAVKSDAFLDRLSRQAEASSDRQESHGGEQQSAADAPDLSDWLRYFNLTNADLSETRLNEPSKPTATTPDSPSPPMPTDAPAMRPTPPGARPTGKHRAVRTSDPSGESETDAADLAFWQRRIDELAAEERTKNIDRPEGR